MSELVAMSGLSTRAVQMLLREAEYLDGKDDRRHNMGVWVSVRPNPCGTSSCAVGDMMLRGEIPMHCRLSACSGPAGGMVGVAESIGIPHRDARWLFGCADSEWFSTPRRIGSPCPSEIHYDRLYETPAQTAARIRKYVYWRLRKAEILADDASRYREGDWRVDREVGERVVIKDFLSARG